MLIPRPYQQDAMAAGKQRARDQGLCITCWHAPVVPNRRQCATCAQRHREKKVERYHARQTQGLCARCGKDSRWDDKHWCFACWEKYHGR
jgi:hypothetical protein